MSIISVLKAAAAATETLATKLETNKKHASIRRAFLGVPHYELFSAVATARFSDEAKLTLMSGGRRHISLEELTNEHVELLGKVTIEPTGTMAMRRFFPYEVRLVVWNDNEVEIVTTKDDSTETYPAYDCNPKHKAMSLLLDLPMDELLAK